MTLNDPWFLLLGLVLPLVFFSYFRKDGCVAISTTATLRRIRPSFLLGARRILPVLRCLCLALVVVALARPRKGLEEIQAITEGIDIVLAIDTSGSMRALDDPKGDARNRLDAAKDAVGRFMKAREEQHDRIGIVAFASYPATQCPLTLDYGVLHEFLANLDFAPKGETSTAIGSAIGQSINLLKNSKAKSKVVILLTDGRSNTGRSPEEILPAAAPFGIRIYTIGVGSDSPHMLREDMFGRKVLVRLDRLDFMIDEDLLRKVAAETGGRYFRATDPASLRGIYADIDRMEKTPIEAKHYADFEDLFPWLLLPAMGLLGVEIVLGGTRFRRIP